MKHIITLLSIFLMSGDLFCQTLTTSIHQPSAGDVKLISKCDSSSALPRLGGTNQVWDFSGLTITGSPMPSTLTLPNPNAQYHSYFPTANLYHNETNTGYYYIVTNDSLTFLAQAGKWTVYNPERVMKWPFSSGSTFTDTYSRKDGGGTTETIESGTITVTGSGTGTLVLPGSRTIENVLQVTTVRKYKIYATMFPNVITNDREIVYEYYHPAVKYPLLTLSYYPDDANNLMFGFILLQSNITVGLKEDQPELLVNVFPVPASDHVAISGLKTIEKIQVFDPTGSLKMELEPNTAEPVIDVHTLAPGVYSVYISSGNRKLYRKLVKL